MVWKYARLSPKGFRWLVDVLDVLRKVLGTFGTISDGVIIGLRWSQEVTQARGFLPNRLTGPIRSSSRKVCPWLGTLSPSHTILPGEQRRSQGRKAVSHRGISTLKNVHPKMCIIMTGNLALFSGFSTF